MLWLAQHSLFCLLPATSTLKHQSTRRQNLQDVGVHLAGLTITCLPSKQPFCAQDAVGLGSHHVPRISNTKISHLTHQCGSPSAIPSAMSDLFLERHKQMSLIRHKMPRAEQSQDSNEV